jgi:hypothetical protein
MTKKSAMTIFTSAPTAMPRKIHALPLESAVVARSTSAHAVPSGYGSSAWASTMRSRRRGIIAERPRTAPRKQRVTTCRYGGATPQRKSAGIVKIVPVASAVEAEHDARDHSFRRELGKRSFARHARRFPAASFRSSWICPAW